MINKIEFSAKNLTSNARLFLLLEHANKNGIFDLIDHDLVFENASTNKIKMNHIKIMLCGNFIGIDKLERLKLLQSDPLINEFAIFLAGKIIRMARSVVLKLPKNYPFQEIYAKSLP